jgi:hypothetical protein
MTTLTEGRYPLEFIVSEAANAKSRSLGAYLAAGQNLDAGAVVGQQLHTSALAAKVSGTGDGNVAAAAVTLGSQARPGVYKLTATAAAAGAGTFSVTTPDGDLLPNLTVGTAYVSDHINLTVPDGATDWGVGAVISVTVAGSGYYTVLNPSASDGSEVAAGILAFPVDATLGAKPAVFIIWNADVNSQEIAWPAGITAGQKTAAIAQLEARKIRLIQGV